ncbi:MAG: ABC transporter ATP-binding protein [Chloroflexi bacterium]|nr:MAG: ABC transporter ATP-binding protein [Chloroflexota bacterium]MBL1197186.1 ABC transporter ATP-binding protein [Chloroflexota bacterium]NOH14480.1 ABC transporter ATP-binding protein [Chloroflexota bacterium]
MTNDISVQMKGVTKRFPGVLANDHIDLTLHAGEVHGLLGENGAGKSTLMNVLFGLYTPDEGEILVNGQPVAITSPATAISLGIGMVHQHFKLVRPFTVTENIILGLDEGSPLLDLKAAERRVAEVAEQYAINVDPRALIHDLSVGQQQRVEILNSLYRGANVLILDEPTAVLTPQEADDLIVTLRGMAEQGKSILFISHKLEEVMKVTDRVTVLRGGRKVFEALTKDTDKQQLAREMIGRQISDLERDESAFVMALAGAGEDLGIEHHDVGSSQKQAILTVSDLHVKDDRDLTAVRGMSFVIHPGEILGIAGVDGNGQRELVEAITGQRPIEQGQVWLEETETTKWSTRDYINHNVAVITEDRQKEGLVLEFNLLRNAVLKIFDRPSFSKNKLLKFNAIDDFTGKLIDGFNISTPNPQVEVGTLSGGNQQKLILARELSQSPSLIIANKPKRGLDIGAAAYVHQKLDDERKRGTAILLISGDLDELFALSDRLLVMYEGQVLGILPIENADIESIGLMMAGSSRSEIASNRSS